MTREATMTVTRAEPAGEAAPPERSRARPAAVVDQPEGEAVVDGKAAARNDGVTPVAGEFFAHSAMLLLGRLVSETVGFYNRRFALEKRDVVRIYGNMARAARHKGHRERAIAAFQEIVKLNPRDPDAHLQLGRLYQEQGQIERATNSFRAVARLRPGSAEACFRLGLCLLRQQQLDEALEQLEKAVKLDPENGRAHQRLGTIYDKKGRGDEAIAALKRAVELEPDQVRYHQQLGFLYESAGRHEDAVACFKKVLELESLADEEL